MRQGSSPPHSLAVGLEQFAERLCVELVVAEVQGRVDGLERLKIYVDLFLLAVLRQDGTRVQHQAIGGDLRSAITWCLVLRVQKALSCLQSVQAVWWAPPYGAKPAEKVIYLVIQFQPLLRGCDGAEHRLPVDTTLDIARRAILISKHLLHTCNLQADQTQR